MSGLAGKVVLITGASSGIGAGTAEHMASLGCKLSLVARNEEALQNVKAACSSAGSPDVFTTIRDLSIDENCQRAIEETVEHFGGLDVLVNNAGIFCKNTLDNMTTEAFDSSMNVNVRSALRLTQFAIPHMEKSEKNPSIVNVSSIAGLRAFPGALAYKLSKAAMDQMTRCTAVEVASKGIRVNSVNPGVIETELFLKAGMSIKSNKQYMERSKRTHPLGRPGRVDEVAKAIAFLASDDASFIVGQTLAVDGGRSVLCPS